MKRTIKTFGDLRQLRDAIGARIAETTERIAERGAARLTELARARFDAGQTVSGEAFGVSKTTGKALTLKKSGDLERAATTYEASGSTIRASVADVRYARYQLGRGILPRGMPAEFHAELEAIAREEIAAALQKVGT